MTNEPITAVCFTWAIPGGLWIETASGKRTWITGAELQARVGADEAARLNEIAHHNGWTGMWYNATNGRNCYAAGERVN